MKVTGLMAKCMARVFKSEEMEQYMTEKDMKENIGSGRFMEKVQ